MGKTDGSESSFGCIERWALVAGYGLAQQQMPENTMPRASIWNNYSIQVISYSRAAHISVFQEDDRPVNDFARNAYVHFSG